MLTLYFCITQILDIVRYIYKQLGSTKTKQASHILQYITHLHQHTWSIHNSYVSKMCIQNIANIFVGFWIRAGWILRESRENQCTANISTFTVVIFEVWLTIESLFMLCNNYSISKNTDETNILNLPLTGWRVSPLPCRPLTAPSRCWPRPRWWWRANQRRARRVVATRPPSA